MATLATNVSFQCLGLDGKPLVGGKVYTYSAGTTTPKTTYTNMQDNVPNTNPVILDQNGKAKIFLGDGVYRLRVLDSDGALVDDIDQISRYVTQSEFASFQQIVGEGVSQLTEVREQIDVFVGTAIGNQKGFASGVVPLDENVKIDPVYLPAATDLNIGAVKLNNTLTSTSITQAATAATVKKLNDEKLPTTYAFGISQTWQNMTASRALTTTYTNSTSRAIVVCVIGYMSAGNALSGTVNGSVVQSFSGLSSGLTSTVTLNVPPNGTYSVTGAIEEWWELR